MTKLTREKGTVFVHAVAHLQSTFATNATIRLEYPQSTELRQAIGSGFDVQDPVEADNDTNPRRELTISLGNIQYGQSREIYLRRTQLLDEMDPPTVSAVLKYRKMTETVYKTAAHRSLVDFTTEFGEDDIAYHVSRSSVCAFISSIFPISEKHEHGAKAFTAELGVSLRELIRTIPAARFPKHPGNAALMQDLAGQMSLAVERLDYYARWGVHYLPSLQGAHVRQLCNSFKDLGPLQYGKDSPLFIKCRDRLDNLFDALPAPVPSNYHIPLEGTGRLRMARYHRASNPCFASYNEVLLADGSMEKVGKLRRGMVVVTPAGPRKVVAVLKTAAREEAMVRVGRLVVTPWHPVLKEGELRWVFPTHVAERRVRYTGSICSVLLQRDVNADAHAVMIGGLWGVTLGHGVLNGDDARAHRFFGDYGRVTESLASLGVSARGVVLGGGVMRNEETHRVCGFKKARRGRRTAPSRRSGNLVLLKAEYFNRS